jgi:hypothetical protein
MVMIGTLSLVACKKSVPNDIVQKSLKNALARAPMTATNMCGVPVKGLTGVTVNVTKRGENNTGVAHIKGTPLFAQGTAPSHCEGDVEFAYYSYTARTTGYRRKNTTTTWYLDNLNLIAVQTKGVTLKPTTEKPDDDDQ